MCNQRYAPLSSTDLIGRFGDFAKLIAVIVTEDLDTRKFWLPDGTFLGSVSAKAERPAPTWGPPCLCVHHGGTLAGEGTNARFKLKCPKCVAEPTAP